MSLPWSDQIVLAGNLTASAFAALALYLDIRNRLKSRNVRSPLIAGRDKDDLDIRRRRSAKRWNERLKLLAAFFNTIGAASFLAIVVVPIVQLGRFNVSVLQLLSGLGIAIGTQIVSQLILTAWKTEE